MAFQEVPIKLVNGPLDRERLMEDVDALGFLLHQPGDPPDVPLDRFELLASVGRGGDGVGLVPPPDRGDDLALQSSARSLSGDLMVRRRPWISKSPSR